MRNNETNTFALDIYEGPLDFLLHLIQKNEIDIYEIAIKKITDQYLGKLKEFTENSVDTGAEFIGSAASLLLLKSKMLLPKHEQLTVLMEESEPDPRFDIIHQLIEYCRFKDMAKTLSEREEQQGVFFGRGIDQVPEVKKPLGIEHLSLSDLASLFKQVLTKAPPKVGSIHEDEWRVSDKIFLVRRMSKELQKIPFGLLFSGDRSRIELIVTFLAILELMKLGEIRVIKESLSNEVYITVPQLILNP